MSYKVVFNGDETYSLSGYKKEVWLRSEVVLTRDSGGNLVFRVQVFGKTLAERDKVGRVVEVQSILQFEGLSPVEVRQWLLIQKSHLPASLNAMPLSVQIGGHLNKMADALTDLQVRLERWRHRQEDIRTIHTAPIYDETTREFEYPESA